MSDHLPVLVLLAPLFGAIAIGLFGMRDHRVCLPVVLSALVLSLCCAIGIVLKVHAGGTLDYFVAGWKAPLGIGIVLRADAINSPILVVIAIVAILAAVFTVRHAGERDTEKTPPFYILFLLLCVAVRCVAAATPARQGDVSKVVVVATQRVARSLRRRSLGC